MLKKFTKVLLIVMAFVLLLPYSYRLVTQWMPTIPANPGSVFIPADFWFQANTSTAGTQLTSTILAASIVSGQTPSWTLSPATFTTFAMAASQTNCAMQTPIKVGATTYPTSSTQQSFALTDSTSFVTFTMLPASGQGLITSVAGCIILGPPTSGFQLYDFLTLYDGNGKYTVFPQLSNGAGSNYVVRMETDPGGVTTHSANTVVTSGTTYWYTMQMNEVTKTSTAALYTYPGKVQVGSTMTVANLAGGDPTSNFIKVVVGNNENGNGTGTTTFQNTVINLSGTYTLGP